MLVLSWNLFHGRALPPVNRSLYREFASKLAAWDWDIALLQEVPPWWPERLGRDLGVEQRRALTSRNALLGLRRAVAERWPELAKANGGGCNAILSRLPISEHGVLRLCRRPERRVAQLVRLSDGTRLVNLHASRKRAGAEEELARLLERVVPWAAGEPLILGGDLNLRAPEAPLTHLAGHNVDHIFAQRFVLSDEARLLDRTVLGAERFELSDHAALLLDVRPVERPLSQ